MTKLQFTGLALLAVMVLALPNSQNGSRAVEVPVVISEPTSEPTVPGITDPVENVLPEQAAPKSVPPAAAPAASHEASSEGNARAFPRLRGGSEYKVFSGRIRDRIFTGDRDLRHPFGGRFRRCG